MLKMLTCMPHWARKTLGRLSCGLKVVTLLGESLELRIWGEIKNSSGSSSPWARGRMSACPSRICCPRTCSHGSRTFHG